MSTTLSLRTGAVAGLALFVAVHSQAADVTKGEIVKDGVTYTEETRTGPDGKVRTYLVQKPGQETVTTTRSVETSGEVTTTTRTVSPGLTTNVSITRSKEVQDRDDAVGNAMYAALAACQPHQNSVEHPFSKGQKIVMQVHGLIEGKCKWTQSFNGDVITACHFSESQRKDLQTRKEAALQQFMVDGATCKISH